MSAPLSTLRSGVRGEPVDYRVDSPVSIRILHLAEKELGYEHALCGKRRDAPLDPSADGELCIICREIYFRKHGHEYGKDVPGC